MIGRRILLGGAAAVRFGTARAALPVPAGDRLGFHIMRKGDRIGEHNLTFKRAGDELVVSVAVDIVVGLGPIALFRYKHRATVHLDGDHVVSISAETDDDGTPEHMRARREKAGLVVEGTKAAQYIAPAHSLPGTHWNRAMLNAPFINTEDGRLMQPVVTLVGIETVEVTGGSVQAQHFSLRGDVNLDTYYDLTPSWVGLRFKAHDGSEVRYLKA